MGADQYDVGTGLAIPGLEAVLEYGDSSKISRDSIAGAMRINDRSTLERARLTQIDGLQGDPDGRDSRQDNSDRHGEQAGSMFYQGRTIGLTGRAEAGSIPAMRDVWTRLQSTFGVRERDLLIHTPGEINQVINQLTNPSLEEDADQWLSSSSSGTLTPIAGGIVDGDHRVGSASTASAAGSGFIDLRTPSSGIAWDGEDVWVTAHMKIHAASGSTVSNMYLGIYEQDTQVSSKNTFRITQQASPMVGTWYVLEMRVSGALIQPGTSLVGVHAYVEFDGAGSYELRIDRVALVLLDQSDATPSGYFDGDTDGYEWSGDHHKSTSFGPSYTINRASNSRLDEYDTSGAIIGWEARNSTGVTVTKGPIVAKSWAGDDVAKSIYYRATKDNNTTSRDIGVVSRGPINNRHEVISGRQYRWSFKANVISAPATGVLAGSIVWCGYDGSVISSTSGSPMPLGESSQVISGVAPDGAGSAYFVIQASTVVTPLAVLGLYASDACIVDTSDSVPEPFFGSGGASYEVATTSTEGNLPSARRRVPRPWIIYGVRKTSDAKAPEQQQGLSAWRAFTMALRASDPRIYVLDQLKRPIKMVGQPNFVTYQAPDGFSLESGSLAVPTGWTYDGQFVTHPGVGNAYRWSRESYRDPIGGGAVRIGPNYPNGGVGIRVWDNAGSVGTNRPASDLRARMYRSLESYTYDNPRVILGCAPQSSGSGSALDGGDSRFMNYYDSGTTVYCNTATILLKRVATGTWLELRWNSVANDFGTRGGTTDCPFAFELWSSHNASGVLSTTRLAAWDYESFESFWGSYDFSTRDEALYLVSWMLSDVVYWQLWTAYPSGISDVGLIESGSFSLPSGLVSVLGSGVAGQVGMSLDIDRGNNDTAWQTLAARPPYMHYFEARLADVNPGMASAPVIGSIDSPQVIELRGGMVDPVVSILTPETQDSPERLSVARFTGTTLESDPIFVDVSDGSVRNSSGVSRRDLVVPGSNFVPFTPGVNVVSVQAKDWDTSAPAHAVVSWRDALAG